MSSILDINPYIGGMETRLRFGEWLLDRILASEMTQDAFAVAVGVSQGSVSNWVNGTTLPNPGNARDIARVLECDLEKLRWRIAEDRKRKARVSRLEEVVPTKKRVGAEHLGRVPASRPGWRDMESERRMIELPESWLRDVRSPALVVEVDGDCLTDRGIYNGDIIVCEKVTDPRSVPQGKIVLVRIEDEFTLKVWNWIGHEQAELCDGTGAVIVTLSEGIDFEVLGIARKRYGDII